MQMKNKKCLLFWGELPSTVIHGISLSNQRILSALADDFNIYKVEDNTTFGGRGWALYSFFVSLFKLVFFSCKQVDIYYVNLPMSYFGLYKVYLSALVVKFISPRVRIVPHLHRGDFLTFIESSRNRKLFKKFSSKVQTILVLSKSAATELSATPLIINQTKIEVLHNTVSVVTHKDEIFSLLYNKINKQSFYCLCNYIPTKRIHKLVEIVNAIPVSNMSFNGAISNASYMHQLKALDKNSICSFDSVINGDRKESKIRSSKALILPSLNEGMPLVILESLAQATPVICFDVGYIRDYLGDDYPGLVTELTDDALREKIQWLDGLPNEEYLSLSKRSFDIFWGRFEARKINASTLAIFNRL